MAVDTRQVKVTAIGAILGSLLTFALTTGFGGCTPHVPFVPGPDPVKQGSHVIVMVDDTAPSIPQGIILDSPIFDAMKLKGMVSIVGIQEKFLQEQGYNFLVDEAGGAPAIAVLDEDGSKCVATKMPTDQKAMEALLKKHVLGLPPPLAQSKKLPPVINRGSDIPLKHDPEARMDWIQIDGTVRKLAAFPNPIKFGTLPRYGTNNPIFPESQWRDLDRRNLFGSEDWVLNQGQVSSCVGQGWAGGLRRTRFLNGMADVKLSPAFVYSLINGNQDNGAVISDAIEQLKKWGTCPFDMLGQKPFYQRQISQECKDIAQRFRLQDAYGCHSWEEVCSALQTGRYVVVFGIMVGNTWNKFDQYGVSGHDRGYGNHCVMADGMRKLPDGRWCLDTVNSWGMDFGPWKNGRVYQDKQHLFGGGCQPNACAIRLPARDPQDKNKPPKYRKMANADLAF